MVPNNEPLKIKWSFKASEVEDEAIGEDLYLDVENSKNVQCYNCQKFEHYTSDCWYRNEDLTNLVEATNDVGNNSTLLLTHDDSSVQNGVWYFDSGASNDM